MLNVEQGYCTCNWTVGCYFLAVDAPKYLLVLGFDYRWNVAA